MYVMLFRTLWLSLLVTVSTYVCRFEALGIPSLGIQEKYKILLVNFGEEIENIRRVNITRIFSNTILQPLDSTAKN